MPIPSGTGGRFAQHSRMAFSQSFWNCAQGKMNVSVCMSFHACGFLDHMFMFNSLHICAGNNSSSPQRSDHSLSGLVRHILNLNDVGSSGPNLVSLLCDGTQSPVTYTFNSIFCSAKMCRSTDRIHEVRVNCIPLGYVIVMRSYIFTFGLIKCEISVIMNFIVSVHCLANSSQLWAERRICDNDCFGYLFIRNAFQQACKSKHFADL